MADAALLQAAQEVKHLSIVTRGNMIRKVSQEKGFSPDQKDLLELMLKFPEAAERVLIDRICGATA